MTYTMTTPLQQAAAALMDAMDQTDFTCRLGEQLDALEKALEAEQAQAVEPVCSQCKGLGYYDEGHENDDGSMSGGNYVDCACNKKDFTQCTTVTNDCLGGCKSLSEHQNYTHPAPPLEYDQQAMELCEECGWKAIMPGEPCFVCNMKTEAQQVAVPEVLPVGECFKNGNVCAKCGHDEFIVADSASPATGERAGLVVRQKEMAGIMASYGHDGCAALLIESIEMLEADAQEIEGWEEDQKENLRNQVALQEQINGLKAQQVAVPEWKAEQIDEFEIRVTSPEGEAWRLRSAEKNDIFNSFIWRWAKSMITAQGAKPC